MSPLSPRLLAAQRAFIISLSLLRDAADMRPRRRDFLAPPPALRPPLTRARRARAAAAILARVAADMVRPLGRLPPPVFAPALLAARPPPTKPANRRSRASIWRRKETASSNCLSDKSIQYHCTSIAEREEGQIITATCLPTLETR
jgi:hypothetical protein